MKNKVIISCAITGSIHTPSMSPHLPVTASEIADRSEEHTSELQSLMRISYAVFCLKKKKKIAKIATIKTIMTIRLQQPNLWQKLINNIVARHSDSYNINQT